MRVRDGEFVVAGGKASPLFGVAESAFDNVATSVVSSVECGWSPAPGAAPLAVANLVAGFGDHSDDAAPAEVSSDCPGRVCLVATDPVRSGTRTTSVFPLDAQVTHQDGKHWRIARVTRPDDHDQRQPAAIDELVDLRAQTAPRPANSMIRELGPQILVIRQVPLCPAGGCWSVDVLG